MVALPVSCETLTSYWFFQKSNTFSLLFLCSRYDKERTVFAVFVVTKEWINKRAGVTVDRRTIKTCTDKLQSQSWNWRESNVECQWWTYHHHPWENRARRYQNKQQFRGHQLQASYIFTAGLGWMASLRLCSRSDMCQWWSVTLREFNVSALFI